MSGCHSSPERHTQGCQGLTAGEACKEGRQAGDMLCCMLGNREELTAGAMQACSSDWQWCCAEKQCHVLGMFDMLLCP